MMRRRQAISLRYQSFLGLRFHQRRIHRWENSGQAKVGIIRIFPRVERWFLSCNLLCVSETAFAFAYQSKTIFLKVAAFRAAAKIIILGNILFT
jgi:hypothetical protein